MPTNASAALRAAVHDALMSDARVTSVLGGPKIYDEPPRAAAFPYVTLGEARIADFSAGNERGEEHQLTLHAWSRQGGHREAHVITGALMQALDDAPLTLADHHLGQFPLCGGRRAPGRRRPHLSRSVAVPRGDRARVMLHHDEDRSLRDPLQTKNPRAGVPRSVKVWGVSEVAAI